jgi:hypothetical protein
MAQTEQKAASTAQVPADDKITEKQALDERGKVKPGFGFRYVPDRDADGRRISRREFFKAGS